MPAAAVTTVRASAPGRVNLIGEHTDDGGGYVLLVAIPLQARVSLAPRDDLIVRVRSASHTEDGLVEYRVGAEQRRGHWSDYVAGVTASLVAAGYPVRGFVGRIESSVPPGAGLSSSAALTVALLRALRAAFGLDLDDLAVARVAHRAEHDFVGAPVRIMDPVAVSMGQPRAALFLDTRTLAAEHVPIPPEAAIAVIDSGAALRHAAGGDATRRAECEGAARALGVPTLREATLADLERAVLPPPLDRRARYVVSENARVLDMVAALRAGDLARSGALLTAAHASLRDDFELSRPEMDAIVEAAAAEPAVYGARLTGGGAGGPIIVLMRRDAGASPLTIARRCARRAGARVLIADILDGAAPATRDPVAPWPA